RKSDAEREKNEREFEAWIEIDEYERNRRGGHRVTGRERELVGRQDFGPAVRLDLARTRTLAQALWSLENEYAYDGRKRGGTHSCETLRAAEEEEKDSGGIPDPTVAEPGGRKHP